MSKKNASNIYQHPYLPSTISKPPLEAPAGPPSLAAKKWLWTPPVWNNFPHGKNREKTLETLGELMKEMDLCVFFIGDTHSPTPEN